MLSNHPFLSQSALVNMISTYTIDKGKSIVESTSMSPFDKIYHVIQTIIDPTINDHLLVASSDPYHRPYWIENPLVSRLPFAYTPL